MAVTDGALPLRSSACHDRGMHSQNELDRAQATSIDGLSASLPIDLIALGAGLGALVGWGIGAIYRKPGLGAAIGAGVAGGTAGLVFSSLRVTA